MTITRRKSRQVPLCSHCELDIAARGVKVKDISKPDHDSPCVDKKLYVRGCSETESNHSSAKSSHPELLEELEQVVWVQCESSDCLKWRRLTKQQALHLDSALPWYCYLNPDPEYSTCAASQQDYHSYEREVKKSRLHYVTSVLTAGTLVWARMPGYCAWPAVVSPDPVGGRHVCTDYDGDPLSYHVEFLGAKHSHSWVSTQSVDLYGEASKPQKQDDPEKPQVNRPTKKTKASVREKYRGAGVGDAMKEADQLVQCRAEDRLAACKFKFIPEELKPQSKRSYSAETEKSSKKSAPKPCKRKSVASSHSELSNMQTKEVKKQSKPQKILVQGDSSPTWQGNLQECLTQSASMVGRTKEEKFTIDVQMYRRNASAFEHDVRRFMTRNGCPIRRTPVWQCMPITLYQLFLAVYDRNGYYQVCEKKQWGAVYRELSGDMQAKSTEAAKKYYKKNLLPYELYAAGLDYSTALPKADKEKKKSPENVMKDKNPKRRNSKESSVVEKKPRRPSKEYSVVQLNTKDNVEDEGIDDEKQLGDILKEMELYSAQCTDLENSILHGKAGDTHVVWHNSVMTSSHPVAMEVGQGNAPLPGSPMFSSLSSAGMACLVPTCAPSVLEQIQLADISAEFGSPVSSGLIKGFRAPLSSPVSSQGIKVLHEMQTLQEQLNKLEENLTSTRHSRGPLTQLEAVLGPLVDDDPDGLQPMGEEMSTDEMDEEDESMAKLLNDMSKSPVLSFVPNEV